MARPNVSSTLITSTLGKSLPYTFKNGYVSNQEYHDKPRYTGASRLHSR